LRTYAVVGLGYVGLTLAVALAKNNTVWGYDINEHRISELRQNRDRNAQVDALALCTAAIKYTSCIEEIKQANFYIVTVSTPAFFYETPNLEPLISATKKLALVIKPGDVIVYESTVYPGTTERVCVPILEQLSQLRCGKDFDIGYSPERINPGDSQHVLRSITKVIAAQNQPTLDILAETYQELCDTVYRAASIQVAEATKILENTQRDVNIALMNEFAKIMHALNLEMHEVLAGAQTKFGFAPYKPGFVGGHCIAIDPHYLAFVAKRHGVRPDLITAARRVNDDMTHFIIESLMKTLIKNNLDTRDLTIGIFGISYKENVLDTRNSLALKLIKELKALGVQCRVHDPLGDQTRGEPHRITLEDFDALSDLSVAILVVAHDFYHHKRPQILSKCKKPAVLLDIPNLYVNEKKGDEQFIYWSL
jgi:UDP-N-acetyl-D-galactosamine dehydrogenase